jgi:hypothetical protein
MKTTGLLKIIPFLLLSMVAKAQLTGEWTTENGTCYRIRQIENQVFWSMDDRPRVTNIFMGYIAGNTLTGSWIDLPGGNLQGSGTLALRIESANRMVKIDQNGNFLGSVWTRGACNATVVNPPSSRPDLSGTWYDYSSSTGNAGLISRITQQGNKLVFINSFNNQSDGSFIDNTTVIAIGWEGGLKAKLEDGGRRIVWANGSVWDRNQRGNPQPGRPDLSGTWYDYTEWSGNAGLVSKISQQGDKLVFTNSINQQSEGNFIDNSTVIATGWEGGLKATLEDGGRKIVWKNGSVWQRSKR